MSALDESIREALRSVLLEELPRALRDAATNSTAAREHVYLSPATAAQVAEVHPDTIRAWVKAGKLAEHRAGRELRVRRDDLERYLAGGSASLRPSPDEEAVLILARRK